MAYIGDFRLGKTFDLKFTSVSGTFVPTTLAGSPVISAYPDNSTTQLTAGITLTVDFDGVTGLNNVRVVATGGNGYLTATNYQLVITTGTVSAASVVGYVVGQFSIEARSALNPTTADLTLDVSAGGEAGVDWANVGSKTTTNALTGTTIATTQKVDIDTIKTNPVVNGGTITFPTTATLASTTNITAGTITTATNLTTNNDKTGYGLSSTAVQAIWDALTSALTTAGSIGKLIVDNLNATITSRMATYTQPTGFLAATFPGTVASTTNITAGTMTTTTNLTNAATAGDFTATMKTSIGTAVAASAVASVTGNVGGNVTGSVGSVASGGITAASIASNAITSAKIATDAIGAAQLAADAVDEIWDEAMEGSTSARQSLRLANSANGGILSGAATATVDIRDLADTKNRVVATVDANGNRSAVTLDLS